MTIKPEPAAVSSPSRFKRSGATAPVTPQTPPRTALRSGGQWGDRVFRSIATAAGATIIAAIALMAPLVGTAGAHPALGPVIAGDALFACGFALFLWRQRAA